MLTLPGCSIGGVVLTRLVGTVECRGEDVAEVASQGRDRATHPTHEGMYKLSALEAGAGSWSS